MKKIAIILSLAIFVTFHGYTESIDFDADNNITYKYGNLKFRDKEKIDIDSFSEIRVFDAINHDDWNTVKQEIDSGIDINSSVYVDSSKNGITLITETTLLTWALLVGSEKVARKLIENGADLNKSYETQFLIQTVTTRI